MVGQLNLELKQIYNKKFLHLIKININIVF